MSKSNFGIDHELLDKEQEKNLSDCIARSKKATTLLLQGKIEWSELEQCHRLAQEARNLFISSNIRFVHSIASKFRIRPPTMLEDLISEGTIGLIRSIESFDPSKGRVTTYAGYHINQAVIQYLRTYRMIILPDWLSQELSGVRKAYRELKEKYSRCPTPKEVADKCQKCIYVVDLAISIINTKIISKDTRRPKPQRLRHISSGREHYQFNLESTEEPVGKTLENEDFNLEVQRLLERSEIDNRTIEMIKQRFGIGFEEASTLEAVGLSHKISKERARQILRKSLVKVRKIAEEKSWITEHL